MATKADLEAEIQRLHALLDGEGPRFLQVENMTTDHVTLLHPSGEDRLHRTLSPRQRTLLDVAFQDSQDNVLLKSKGVVKWKLAEEIEDDGRDLALGPQFRLEDPRLEGVVRQFLLYEGEDLDNRRSGAVGSVSSVDTRAHILWEIIHAAPDREGGGLAIDYLKRIHLPFLESILMRERLWRNRPGIVVPIAKRIDELRHMDRFGKVSPTHVDDFEESGGGLEFFQPIT
jgi:hypothetical protein